MDQHTLPYKAILADDEPIILRSLEAAIPWEELGIAIAGKARNGEEALRLVQEHQPDMVISDIRMPGLDGISFMKQAMADDPDLVFIIISGYGEFQYAREGLRQGAFDYLLKPIDHDELIAMIRKAVAKLDEGRSKQLEKERLIHSVKALSLLARERMFAELIEGNQQPLGHMYWPQHSELERPYVMLITQLDHFSTIDKRWTAEEKRLWFFAVRNILEEWSSYNQGLTVFPFHSGEWILLFPDGPQEQKLKLGEDIIRHVKQYSKLSCSIGISHAAVGADGLGEAYRSANQALYQRFYADKEGVFIDAEDVIGAGGRSSAVHYPKQLEGEMLECIRTLNVSRMTELFQLLEADFERQAMSKGVDERCVAALAITLYRQFEHLNLAIEGSIDKLLQQLHDAATLRELIEPVQEAVLKWMNANLTSMPSRDDGATAVEKAKKYIENHYHNDLGMDEVSDYVGLSTSHFCTLFKQISGCTFLEYLTQYRIEKAKYMLKNTEIKVFQIAPLIGYQDPRYFTQVFKKLTGQTPSEYRGRD